MAKQQIIESTDNGDEAEPAPQPLVNATVARGRTVLVATGKRKVVGIDKDGSKVYGPISIRRGPGEQIELPGDEVKRLQAGGYLVDPERIAAVEAFRNAFRLCANIAGLGGNL
jgi:hypothetical protein